MVLQVCDVETKMQEEKSMIYTDMSVSEFFFTVGDFFLSLKRFEINSKSLG